MILDGDSLVLVLLVLADGLFIDEFDDVDEAEEAMPFFSWFTEGSERDE